MKFGETIESRRHTLVETLLRVENIAVSYGGIRAVRGVSFCVNEGSVTSVLGRNGAGKSSLVRAVAGIEQCSDGRVTFGKRDITAWSTARRCKAGLSLVPEDRRIIGPLTVRENLLLAAPGPRRDRERRMAAVLTHFSALHDCMNQLGGSLSGGQQQMLAIGRALMAQPRLLILDEPSLGLAPLIVRDVYDVIRKLVAEGQSVLLIEQNAQLALEISSDIYLMNHGEVVASGPPSIFQDSDEVYQMYL